MTSDGIQIRLEAIAEVRGTAKQGLLAMNAPDPEFQRICKLAYDPFITFGISPLIPAPYSENGVEFDEETYKILDALAKRELTGNAARAAIEAESMRLTKRSATLFNNIIGKDLRAGFSEGSLNKAVKGLIPEFPYMRCSLPKDAKMNEWDFAGEGAISQEKADGMFVNVDHEAAVVHHQVIDPVNVMMPGAIRVRTRQGSPFPIERFPYLVAEIQTRIAPNTQTHGELLVINAAGEVLPREIGNGMLNSVSSGGDLDEGHKLLLKVWDSIPLSAVVPKGSYNVPYKVRLGLLFKGLKDVPGQFIRPIDTRIVKGMKEAMAHYKEYLDQGKEGTVLKKMRAVWKDGTSKEQVKLKLEADCELKIVGFRPGEPGKKTEATFGALICQSACGQLEVGVSGMKDEVRQEIHENRDIYLDTIITVKSNMIMEPSASNPLYSLFLPRFVEIREDKSEADTLERIREQFENAVNKVAA